MVAADNLSNTATIDDLSFFAWADNGGAATFSVAVTGVPNATSRMARVWKVDKTNWSDQDITFKVVQGGERYLLVNTTDPAFGAGTTEYAISTSTGTVTLNTANLPDGAYFTLGTKIVGPACVNNGIAMWLRSDYGASPNNWIDFSGNQYSVTQATTANQPALLDNGVNFNPALSLDGTNDFLRNATRLYPATSGFELIAVSKDNRTNFAELRAVMGMGVDGNYPGMDFQTDGVSPNGNNFWMTASTPAEWNGGTLPNVNGKTRISMLSSTNLTAASTDNIRAGINGIAQMTILDAKQQAEIGNGVFVGNSGDAYWKGYLPEVIIYNRELAAFEEQKVHSYLALKYGITLNNGTVDYVASDWNGTAGTKMWTSADNGVYNRRITGIGRDDCDELYQKQSLSIDSGIVALAIGDAVAATNIANVNTIDNDNSYFVFADNDGDIAYSVATTASGLTSTARMGRVWKTDKTNWTDADITFKLNRNASRVYLLISADPSFATGVQEIALNATDSLVNFFSDQLPDGAYFTFGKQLIGPAFVNTGIRVWLDANDGLNAITNGIEWQDKSGNDLHVAQTTDLREANMGVTDLTSNYNDVVDFDGDDVFETDQQVLTSATSDGTVFFVSKYRDLTGYDSPVDFDADDPHLGRLNASVGAYKVGSTPVQFFPGGNQTLTIDKNYLSGFIWGGGTNGGIELRKDAASAADPTMDFNNIGYTQNFGVGAYISGVEGINGTMSEVIVYDRKLSASEVNRVESYLALKYGITLDQTLATHYTASDGTTRMWDASTGDNATYKNNIAGIGRDDLARLLQKQSRSINTVANGNMVAMGLGTIAATNKDNTSTIADDMSFLVWGDNGATGTKTTEYPIGTGSRRLQQDHPTAA